MLLLDLPIELLRYVSEHLDSARDINAFTQANRGLYRLLNDYLYRFNIQHSRGSALHWAASRGREATARRLLENGANINVKALFYSSVLQNAAYNGQEMVAKLLLDSGANINASNEHIGTALLTPSLRGYKDLVKLFLDKGADTSPRIEY